MKHITLTLLAGGSLLAMTAHAQAFEAIGVLIIGALATSGVSVPLGLFTVAGAAAVGQAVVGVALAAVQVGLALANRQKVSTQNIKNTVQGSEGPGRQAFGRVEIEGRLLYGNTAGYNISRLVGHAFGELDRVETYFYDGREITVEADGYVSSPPWARPPGSPASSYMQVLTKVGDGTETAWDTLVSDFDAWTTDHRVRGIAQTLMRITSPGTASEKFGRLLQGGVKAIRLRARMLKPVDPRTDTAAWTLNGPILALHYLRALNGVGDGDFDFEGMAEAAEAADVFVTTLTGTAPRSRLSGGWEGPITSDIVADLMESAGLELIQTDESKWTQRFLEDWPEPEITLTKRHIIDNYPQAGPESGLRPNVCTLTYFSPERRYEKAEIDLTDAPWARVQDEIDAYGDHDLPVNLTFCCDASQAQRIARRLFLLSRADSGILKTNWAGMAVWGKRTGMIEIPDVGEDGASIFVRVRFGAVRPDDAEGTCEIPYVILPDELETPWNPATMEVAPPPILVPQQEESDLETPDAPFGYAQVQYPDMSYELRVGYVTPVGGVTTEAVYRILDGDAYGSSQSMTEEETTVEFSWAATNQIGEDLDFRVRIFDVDEAGSYFSDALEVTNVQIDNSATAAPTLNVTGSNGDWQIEVIAPDDLNVAYVTVEKRIVPAGFSAHDDANARPGETLNLADVTDSVIAAQTIEIRAYAHTSDGTASPVSTVFSFTESP